MGLKSIFKEIKRSLTFWHEINFPPKWVQKAHYRWERKYEQRHGHPHGMSVHFTGKHYLYKIEYVSSGHQGPDLEYWYKKKRIR